MKGLFLMSVLQIMKTMNQECFIMLTDFHLCMINPRLAYFHPFECVLVEHWASKDGRLYNKRKTIK